MARCIGCLSEDVTVKVISDTTVPIAWYCDPCWRGMCELSAKIQAMFNDALAALKG